MPNWCYTTISFHGNKNEIEGLHKVLTTATSKEYIHTDFGNNWLGNVLYEVGLQNRIDNENAKLNLRCRGTIELIEDVDTRQNGVYFLRIGTETAWCPMIKMWQAILDALNYKSVKIAFMSEEPGCELYSKYDPYDEFPDTYFVDGYVEGEDCNNEIICKIIDTGYFDSEDTLVEYLQDLFKTKESNVEELIDQVENYPFKDENSYLFVHKYNTVNLDDFE